MNEMLAGKAVTTRVIGNVTITTERMQWTSERVREGFYFGSEDERKLAMEVQRIQRMWEARKFASCGR